MHHYTLSNAYKCFHILPSKTSTHSVGQKNVCSESFLNSPFSDEHNLQIFFSVTHSGCCTFDINFGFLKKELLNTSLYRVLVHYQDDVSVSTGASKNKSLGFIVQIV